jgi:hypothetical protein
MCRRWQTAWLVGRRNGWQTEWDGWLADGMVGRRDGWQTGWLVGWLVGSQLRHVISTSKLFSIKKALLYKDGRS